MNVHISYKISKTPDLESLINQQIAKLDKYLRVFRPGLVHLKGVVEDTGAPLGFAVSLNLRLPTGQMVAREQAGAIISAVKSTFDALIEQLKKHKQLLRSHHGWPHRRAARDTGVGTVPFEETFAAVRPETISPGDVSQYIDVNLPRLQRYVERQLTYRESQGQLPPGRLTVDDVIGEAIANALSEQNDPPERGKLEPWLYRLANQAIDRLSAPAFDGTEIPLQRSRHGIQNVQASDEPFLQFREPDEPLYEENLIPDSASENPEELAARSELINLVENTLLKGGLHEREAFILYTIEGFTLEEIADITNRHVDEVRASIRRAREHLQSALPIKHPLKEKLVEHARSA